MNAVSRALSFALLATWVAACEPAPRGGLIGTWEYAGLEDTLRLVLRGDSTFHMDLGAWQGEGTFTATEPGIAALQPTGRLAAAIPAGYTATQQGDLLELCSPAGCATYRRVE